MVPYRCLLIMLINVLKIMTGVFCPVHAANDKCQIAWEVMDNIGFTISEKTLIIDLWKRNNLCYRSTVMKTYALICQ